MISIDKMEAFSLVVRSIEKDDTKTASKLMRIISKSIEEDKKISAFLNV